MLGDCCIRRRQDWGTMAAAVNHLGHNGSCGNLWVVPYAGISRVIHQTMVISPQWVEEELPHCLPSGRLGSLNATSVLCHVIRAGTHGSSSMMRSGGGGKLGGRGAGWDNFYTVQSCTLINHGDCRHPMAAMWPHSMRSSKQQSTNILLNKLRHVDFLV